MAALSSFASGAVVYTEDFGTGIASITGGVLTINGALDALDDRIHTIECSSSGGIRSTSGASGTLRATGGRTLNIIERSSANRYGADNGKQSNSNGGNARFAGDATNTLIYEAINWTIEAGGRSDFDFGAGTNANGSLGTGVTMRGVYVNIEAETGNNNNFPHLWSQNAKLEIHPDLGYGLRMANYTQSHGMLIEVQPNATFFGLKIDDISSVASGGGRVVSNPKGGTFTLFNLDTPDITDSDNGAPDEDSKTILINPVGAPPTRSNNWNNTGQGNNGHNMIIEVWRDQPFQFNGADDATGSIKALHQSSHAQAADADGNINSSGAGSVRVLTDYSANQSATYADTDGFQYYATSRGFRKYYSGTTTINVGDTPTTRVVAATKDAFPNGDAITDYTSTDGAGTASEIYRIIKKHEAANPTHRTLGASLATIDDDGNIDIDSTVALNVSITQSGLSAWNAETSTLTVKVVAGITADKGINSLNFGNRSIEAMQIGYFHMPTTTSLGTSSLLNITAHANEVVGVFKNGGAKLGHNAFASDGTWQLKVSAADSLANTRIGLVRPGYEGLGKTINLADGGVFDVEFDALKQIPGADGTAKYDSTQNAANLVVGEVVASSSAADGGYVAKSVGDCILKLKAGTPYPSAADVFTAYHDAVGASTGDGARVPAFGRQYLDAVALTGQPGNVFLGANCIFSRFTSSETGAYLQAYPFGGIMGYQVDGPPEGFISFQITVGSCNLDLINENITGVSTKVDETKTQVAAVKAQADILQEQNEHLATSLPLSLHEPLSPLAIVTGLEGQEIIRDTEETDWPLTSSGTAANGDPEAHGVVEFDGNNSSLDYSLNRAAAGETPDLYTAEIIVLCQIYPTSFPTSGQRPFGNIGALTLSVNNSTGSTAALHLGAGAGATTTTNQINLNRWNDLVFVFTQNPDRPNNPRIRVSINGSAQETGNLGADSTLGNNIFGPIASNTQNFRIGGHGTGVHTSGFQGRARAIFVHPDNEVFGTDGWDIPSGIYWNTANQLWQGAQLMDRVEGIAVDRIERQINTIEEKTYTSDELGIFPWRALTSQLTSADNSIGKKLAELNDPETKENIAAAVRDVSNSSPAANSLGAAVKAIPTTEPDSKEDIADAVLDELLSGHTTAGSLGKKIADIPSADMNAATTWNSLIVDYTSTGSMGKKMGEVSTHGAPAGAPEATDVAEAVRDITLTGAAANSLGAKLAGLSSKEDIAAAVKTAIMDHAIETNVSYEEAFQAIAAALGGKADVNGNVVDAKSIGGGDTTRLRLTMGDTAGQRTASVIPDDDD